MAVTAEESQPQPEQLLSHVREWRSSIATFQGNYRHEVEIFRDAQGLPSTYTLDDAEYRFSGDAYYAKYTLLEKRDGTTQDLGDILKSSRYDGEILFLSDKDGTYYAEKKRRRTWPPNNALTPRMLLGYEPGRFWAWGNHLAENVAPFDVRQEEGRYVLWQLPNSEPGGGHPGESRINIYFNEELLIERIEHVSRPPCSIDEIMQLSDSDPFKIQDIFYVWEFSDYHWFDGIPFPCQAVFTSYSYSNLDDVNQVRFKFQRGEVSACEMLIEEKQVSVLAPKMTQRVTFDPATIVLNEPLSEKDLTFTIPPNTPIVEFLEDDTTELSYTEDTWFRQHADIITFLAALLLLVLIAVATWHYWYRR